ncbi:claudin-3-like [Hypomesus transpacificus]|uniref:claudin-3-like n=1 Tax=Hypomesus transpacificus TaxID=137520 RepID=UPI001F075204|nr:claudin-3-like [Hypomesus transpacificus]
MYSAGIEILGMILSVAGWLGVMVACGLPMWRVAAYIGQNIVISQVIWEGLWMNCSVQSTGQMHCKVHDSMLGLPVDLQAARALVIVSMVMGIVGIGLSVAGAKCTNCSSDAGSKPRIVLAAGVTFIVAGLLLLVAVSWTANAIVLDFYDPLLEETENQSFFFLGQMAAAGLEILGVTLAALGWISGIVSCALPMWRVSAFIGVNIVTAQNFWEGIWMSCVVQSTGQMQCKVYDSMLALSTDLQAARALTIISILVGIMGVLVAVVGAKCTNCVEEETAKARVMITAGVAFIVASLTQLIPVSWSAHTIVMEFYNPLIPEAQKREIGGALYLGWAAAAFLLIGGCILCCSCPPQTEKRYAPPSRIVYSPNRSVAPSGYDKRDYV